MAAWAIAAIAALAAGYAVDALLRARYLDRDAEERAAVARASAKGGARRARGAKGALDALAAALPLSKADSDACRARLARAGVKADPRTWRGGELALRAGMGVAFAAVGSSFEGAWPVAAGAAFGVALAWALPKAYLASRERGRRAAIEAQLPDALDLLAINVQSGSTLMRGVRLVSERMGGPLAEEFGQVDRDVNMLNLSSADAIARMARRCSSPQVGIFASATTQSIRQGANVEPTLRAQAEIARKMQFDALEEKANRLSVKAVVPMVLFFMPACVAAVGAPALAMVARALGTAMGAAS